ncbi:DeoR/GlpR family DNA-binding transcription regulator [Virgisporangium aurantiacum]
MPGTLRRADRVTAIVDRLGSQGSVQVDALAAEFAVSAATIRRDLQSLEDQNLLRRNHGGAVAVNLGAELPVRYRIGQRRDQKRAIAKAAAARLPHGRLMLGLTGGTTTHMVSRLLANRYDLAVVTNALNIAAGLSGRPRRGVLTTGGLTRSQPFELVGPIAEQVLAGFDLDVAVVGVDGITAAHGLTTHDRLEAATNAVMIRQARRVIVVADASKIGRAWSARICPLGDVDELVTHRSADSAALDAIRARGVEVVLAA